MVPPSDFVPLSEEMGISDVLFESIMRTVCRDVATWRSLGDWEIPVSVNLPTQVAGRSIRVQFAFDSVDDLGNQGEGAYIDDVVVSSICEP